MRAVLVLTLLVGCSGGMGGSGCPALEESGIVPVEGAACATAAGEECFASNSFSPCMAGWYACVGGKFHRTRGIDAEDGHACADSPLTSCTYEGNPTCGIEPYGKSCSCDGNGTWQCTCACYDGLECPICPDVPMPGVMCGPAGNTCSYPGQTCSCTGGTFHCT
jgi:hypothetical protein